MHFHVFTTHETILERMKKVVECLGVPDVTLQVYTAPGHFLSRHRPSLNSSANAVRLFLGSVLPKEVRKVMWLDSDILVLRDVRELWQLFDTTTSLYTIAGVPRVDNKTLFQFFRAPGNHPALPLFEKRYGRPMPLDKVGFNAGAIMLNLDHIRHNDSYLEREVRWWMRINHNHMLWSGGSQPLMLLMYITGQRQALLH